MAQEPWSPHIEVVVWNLTKNKKMATMIFIDQENGDVAASLLSKNRVNLSNAGRTVVKGHQGKAFSDSASEEKTLRKALGNVNKQVNQKPVQPLKGNVTVKKAAAKKVSKASLKPDKPCYPEIETFIPYNPADFDTFAVPEKHKLSHLSLAGVGLMVNVEDAKKFESLLSLEPSPMEIPACSWESDAADCLPSFLATLEEITLELPPILQC
ncbi:securin-like isoform X2 [Rhinoderma darwinii]|uniref:securin-like isoform X2 n=1 Tax=Rhinoderma darwinii TaxID=43563 RepID=UPI003F67CB5B